MDTIIDGGGEVGMSDQEVCAWRLSSKIVNTVGKWAFIVRICVEA